MMQYKNYRFNKSWLSMSFCPCECNSYHTPNQSLTEFFWQFLFHFSTNKLEMYFLLACACGARRFWFPNSKSFKTDRGHATNQRRPTTQAIIASCKYSLVHFEKTTSHHFFFSLSVLPLTTTVATTTNNCNNDDLLIRCSLVSYQGGYLKSYLLYPLFIRRILERFW